jgi:ELWxxDGT repeat protein
MQKVLFFIVALFCSFEAHSQVIELVKVINPKGDANPDSFQVYNNKLYFAADDGVHGRELWVTDGTEPGTRLVKDIKTIGSSFPHYLTVFNGKMYFQAMDDTNGVELWETDGTEEGTKLFFDLNPNGDSYPGYFFVLDSIMVFRANSDWINGSELWKTDGTLQGTSIIIQSDTVIPNYSFIYGFVRFKDKLLFTGNFGNAGSGLWSTDGTTGGTELVRDSANKPVGVQIGNTVDLKFRLLATSDRFYFCSSNGVDGLEPWVSDGTSKGTFMIKNINPEGDSYPVGFTEYNNRIYFGARTSNTPERTAVFSTDGTAERTFLLRHHNEYFPYDYIAYNDLLFYSGSDSATGVELYVSDGSQAGTQMLKDISPVWHGLPKNFFIYNGLLYFSAFANQGCQLWRSDGTASGTYQVPLGFVSYKFPILGEEYKQYIEYNDAIYYSARYDSAQRNQLWRMRDTTLSGIRHEVSSHTSLSIYPNPAERYIKFNPPHISKMVFRDLLGNEVIYKNTSTTELDISHLPAGVYFVTSDIDPMPVKFVKK